MEFGNAGDVFAELIQAAPNGRDLESVGKPRISVSGLLGLGNDGDRFVLVAHGNKRKISRGRNMGLPRRRSRPLSPDHHPTVRP